ncbi:hypothetical protein [Paenibacillus methanolicus]|uniref:Uncharacterized protein n=1 Tax=Paenibacillus methanolicus TaxID=582686 RepID=A0A5S5BX64_9BACL|nr:hypothetical protein [Paenibacillus methanolicus]TYP70730.1 hypothetical protein BCM02_111237 [Paenibacillus methanolicus]
MHATMSGLTKTRAAGDTQAESTGLARGAEVQVDPNLQSLERLEAGGPMKVTDWSALPARTRILVLLLATAALAAVGFAAYAAIAIS